MSNKDEPYIMEKDEKLWLFSKVKGNPKLTAYLKALIIEDQKKKIVEICRDTLTSNPIHSHSMTDSGGKVTNNSSENTWDGTGGATSAADASEEDADRDSDDEF
jgi:hypothetical protein